MDSYDILWKRSVEKDLRRIEAGQVRKILEKITALSDNPFPPGCRKLKGSERTYRIRAGDYRIVYQVDVESHLVIVYYVRHRRDAYR